MKIKPINSQLIKVVENIFYVLFSIYATLGFCSYTHGKFIVTIVMWPAFLIGMFLVGYRALNFKKYFKMPFLPILICLLGSIGISTLVNYRYSLKGNLIFCIYWAFYFLVFYTLGLGCSSEEIKKKFCLAATVYCSIISLMVLASFYTFFMGYSVKLVDPVTSFEYYIGFAIGRLSGVFINSVAGADSCAICSLLLVYFIHTVKRTWCRILFVLMIILNIFYIALSDSRAGALCFGLCAGFLTFFLLLYKFKNKKLGFKFLAVVCACVVLVLGILIPRGTKSAYNKLAPIVHNTISSLKGSSDNEDIEDENSFPIVERGYDLSEDFSNRRLDLWKSSFEIFSHSAKNILIGTGYSGIMEYAQDNIPETYMVTNPVKGIRTFENEFFNILAAQGVLGVLTVAVLIVLVMLFIIKRFFIKENDAFILVVMLSCIFSISAVSMVGARMFYHFSQIPIIFWTFLGLSINLLSLNKGGKNTDE